MKIIRENRRTSPQAKTLLKTSAAVLALSAWGVDAMAQDQAADQVEEIVITGSRVARTGFTAPTPVTVLGAEQIQRLGDTNVGQALNRLPAFRAQTSLTTGGLSAAQAGAIILDLRGLGAQRTLVLVDGRRFVPSTTQGTFDISLIPSSLLERTEVVTGGASAAYGSDAVAGVVNLILNKNLNGIRAQMQYGQTSRGDGQEYQASVAAGSSVFEGRGHIVVGLEYVKSRRIGDCFTRSWCSTDGRSDYYTIGNPAAAGSNGYPATVIAPVVSSLLAEGGVITSGPLRGTQFVGSGVPAPWTFGALQGSFFMIGGEQTARNWNHVGLLIQPAFERHTFYTHLDYDITDKLKSFVDVSYGAVDGRGLSATPRDTAITIRRDNPFIPAATQAAMDAAGVTSFTMGRITNETGIPPQISNRSAFRTAAGLSGDLFAGLKWDAYYQYGRTNYTMDATGIRINSNFTRAVDAVRNAQGQIVCRSTLTDPTNGCAPMNLFGTNNISQAALAYAFGNPHQNTRFTQHVLAGNVTGEPFSTWAGPVSIAVGGEYRYDRAAGETDSISAVNGFYVANGAAINGKIRVIEGYAETVVPLAADMAFAKKIEFNGAVRRTHYSTSGSVTTWKAGLVWEPNDLIRFRATRSRDIRAPNMVELYGSLTAGIQFITDPTNNVQVNTRTLTGGNPQLKPEIGDTISAGFVLQPKGEWLGGLRASVDYYDIEIKGAVASLGAQLILNRCFATNSNDFCQFVARNGDGSLNTVTNAQLNLNKLITRGIDFEVGYNLPLSKVSGGLNGDLDLRILATYVSDLTTVDGTGLVTNRAGQAGAPVSALSGMPNWMVNSAISYRNGPLSLSLMTRYIQGGKYDVTLVGPDDPGYSINLRNSISTNRVSGRYYFNLSGQYDVIDKGDSKVELYGAIDNLFDRSPPVAPSSQGPYNNVLFDPIGRTFRVGVRLQH